MDSWIGVRHVPHARPVRDRRALLEATQRLRDLERDDLRRARRLRRRLRRQRHDTSLLGILAELLEADTRKHLAVISPPRRP